MCADQDADSSEAAKKEKEHKHSWHFLEVSLLLTDSCGLGVDKARPL